MQLSSSYLKTIDDDSYNFSAFILTIWCRVIGIICIMKVLKEVKHVAYENVEQRRPEKTLKEFQTKFCFTKLNA